MCDARPLVMPVRGPGAGTQAIQGKEATPLEPIPLEPVDGLTITTLVDNSVDQILPDQGCAKRVGVLDPALPRVPTDVLLSGEAVDALRAEHGFSALVTITRGTSRCRVLFDAGLSPDGMVENMRRLDIDPTDIDVIVLSHGHLDHTTGMHGFIRAVGRTSLPVVIHPDFWLRRRVRLDGPNALELPSTSRRALEGAGFAIIERPDPSFLLGGALLVTGEVARTTAFETGFPGHEAWRDGAWAPDPLILDDQALIAHVRGKGLVILTGCGHSGVVNLVRHARRLTGIDAVHAVIGGFHLSGAAFEPIIPDTVDALAALTPDVVVPAHCTGWRATHALAAALPAAFLPNSVGTRFELTASP